MKFRKQFAFILVCAICSGVLSGCNRTIIEHQFHTDTITNTEQIVEYEKVLSPAVFPKLTELLASHGKNIPKKYIYGFSLNPPTDIQESFDGIFSSQLGNSISLEDFFKKQAAIYDICDDGFNNGLAVILERDVEICKALEEYELEHPDVWEKIDAVAISVKMFHVQYEGKQKTFIMTTFTNDSESVL